MLPKLVQFVISTNPVIIGLSPVLYVAITKFDDAEAPDLPTVSDPVNVSPHFNLTTSFDDIDVKDEFTLESVFQGVL